MAKMNAYATFDLYLAAQAPENQEIIGALRRFVKKTAPKLQEAVKWGNGCWLKGTVPVAYVYADKGCVQFGFTLGSALDDPQRLLQGSAQHVRHIKVRGLGDIDAKSFGALLRQAVQVTPESFAELRTSAGRSRAKPGKAPSKRTKKPAARKRRS